MIRRSNQQSSDWICEKVNSLLDSSTELVAISNIHYPGHAWSVVKLLLLGGWIYVYTTIIPKYFQQYWYIDLLAGAGTTHIEETQDVVIGSPFIAHFLAQNSFKKYIFVEKKHDRCEALKQRVTKLVGDRGQVVEGDCNEIILSILPKEKGVHSLVFIDNEGFNTVWKTMESILAANTDVLMLFPTCSIKRVTNERTRGALDRFYGNTSWRDAQNEEDFLRIYLQQLKERFEILRNKQVYISSVRVGTGQFFYDIVLICRKGPYTHAWDYLKKRLNWKDPRTIETTLDILKGRTTRIDWFLDLQEKVASIRSERKTKKIKDASLNGFLV